PDPGPAVTPPAPRPPEATGTPARGVLVTGEGGTPLAAAPGGAPYGRLRANVALSYDRRKDGWARVLTPCENRAWAPLRSGEVVESVDVVIDPGHGAGEPGAVGPTGLTEAELNMDVARRTVAALRRAGVSAALARPHNSRVTLVSRVAIAKALRPAAFVSIHHNAAPDVTNQPKPGSEMYYQIASAESKRLAGLLYVETIDALSAFPAQWAADTDAGAKVRRNLSGGDYYGILRHSFNGGVTGVLAEMAFISNPSEEALLLRNDVRDAEAAAVTRALVRFLRTDDQGAGFVDAYARNAPAGGGGGAGGCVDPG
ncbi:MAG: N-acetylmuramoyl-L-alanine amidase family protein, partial [Acidimicrobiia bacterium]